MRTHAIARLASWVWIALTVIGVTYLAFQHGCTLLTQIVMTPLSSFVLALGFALAGKIVLVIQVGDSLSEVNLSFTLPECFRYYSYADISKYAPGGIWGVLGRAAMYKSRGYPAVLIGRALAIEHLWMISGAFVVGGIFYLPALTSAAWFEDFLPPFVLLAAPVLLLAVWLFAVKFGTRLLSGHIYPWGRLIRTLLLQLLIWFLIGMSLPALLEAGGSNVSHVLIASGTVALAFGLGFLSFFAPAGIGVREVAITALLAPIYSVEVAAAGALAHRALLIAADAALAMIVWGLSVLSERGR